MAIYSDFPIKHGDFPKFFVCLPEGTPVVKESANITMIHKASWTATRQLIHLEAAMTEELSPHFQSLLGACPFLVTPLHQALRFAAQAIWSSASCDCCRGRNSLKKPNILYANDPLGCLLTICVSSLMISDKVRLFMCVLITIH